MVDRRNMQGQSIDKRKIVKVEGLKRPLKPNGLQLMLNLQPEEAQANKKAFLLKAIDFYEGRLKDLHDIFSNHIQELGFMITAASLMFIIDFSQETYDLIFYDFGCSFPASRMELWNDEQANSLACIIGHLNEVRKEVDRKSVV